MCFDVPKVVRSPGYDHGHDEESRNGRDINIPEKFRIKLECRRVTGTPRGSIGPWWALRGERGQQPGGGVPPPKGSPNWTRGGGWPH